MKRPAFRSIRWRIQAWHGLLLLAVLAGFGGVAYRLQEASSARQLDGELQLRLSPLLGNLARQPPPPPPREQERDEEDEEPPPPRGRPGPHGFRLRPELAPLFAAGADGAQFYYKVWTRDGERLGASAAAPPSSQLPARRNGVGFRTREGCREAYEFTPPGECVLAGVPLAASQRELARFAGWLAAIGAGVLALGLAGGWWLASRAIAPIGVISAAARLIAAGRLDERIRASGGGSELDALADVLNETFARLEAAFAEQARFTSDAAHELRTPVSVLLAQTQLALKRPREAEEYRDSLVTCRRAALRMESLIESLLTLAGFDGRAASLARRPCDLAEITREQLDLLRPLAEARRIALHADLAPAACEADPGRVAQIVVNLLSNAVKYCPPGAEVRASSALENGCAIIRVADTGPGIPAQHLPHLFERFYRADASRNRTTGGAGLGLAICRALAASHGGTLEVASVETEGSTFTLRLPRVPPDEN